MRAVVCYAPGDYRLEERPIPVPGPQEILVKVEACGICAGDIKTFRGAPSFWGDKDQPAYIKAPMIPGHEFVTRAVALGPGAAEKHKVAVGDRLISEQIVPCWQCRFCQSGRYWMCEKHDVYGFQNNVNGAMAEYMIFPKEAIVHRVPDEVPLEEAIVIEPLACSLHAVQRADIQLGDVVVVAGAGTLGLGIIGGARLRGPSKLVALDTRQMRLDLARRLGADLTLNPVETDVVTLVREMTGGYGCDVYIEATGHPAGVVQGLKMVRKLGTFVEFSVFKDEVTVDWSIISDRKELDVRGSHLGPYCYPLAIDAIARRTIDVRGIVTHQYPLEQFGEAMRVMEAGQNSLKVILIP
jgi:threonine dehydrogenase-like Zn-dependent dehydrogenase